MLSLLIPVCFSLGQPPPSVDDISLAYKTVDEAKADKPPPRKRKRNVQDASHEGDELEEGPLKKRRGAVDNVSRVENENMLREMLFK